eukprot:scaffold81716_cov58-Attheya_sp.AAC.3
MGVFHHSRRPVVVVAAAVGRLWLGWVIPQRCADLAFQQHTWHPTTVPVYSLTRMRSLLLRRQASRRH